MNVPDDARLLTLPGDRRAAREAREFASKVLSDWAVQGEAVGDLLLIVSELVANAVVHGAPPVHLRLWIADGMVHGAVDDHGPGRPQFANSGVPHTLDLREHGRGLTLVSAIASSVWWDLLIGGGVRVGFSYVLAAEEHSDH
ncbi:hypothetical protein GCM10010106_22900 [Thermopolyspora flexuosa]|nr:hypothetical protein GCM10010106_22900 [Thermopolyspora flexuosa]